MTGWSQAPIAADGNHRAVQYVDSGGNSTHFGSEVRGSRGDQRRKYRSLHDLSQQLEEGVIAQSWMLSPLDKRGSTSNNSRLAYLDVKKLIERKLAHQKRGLLSENEVRDAVAELRLI